MTIAQKMLGLSVLATATAALSAVPAAEVTPFEAVGVEGGGEVIIRPRQRHSYRVLAGSADGLIITSDRQRGLRIRCHSCRGRAPQIEVTAPVVRALAVDGGGSIRITPGYAPQRSVALAVNGGGLIDSRALDVSDVAASVSGGGSIVTRARSSLAASVRGGGNITYLGTTNVATSIQGGGTVQRAGERG